MLTFTVAETDHCRRAESLLQNLMPAAPTGYVRQLLKGGHLTVSGAPAAPDTLLRAGETVSLKESGRTQQLLVRERPFLDVVFEDQWVAAFNKAPGMPMHRAAEVDERNLVELGAEFFRQRDGFAGKLRPVNRLDRGTSGCVLLAKSPTAAGMFGRFIREEGLAKLYLAVVTGKVSAEGSIEHPVEGKEAVTRFRLLWQGEGWAFVAVTPVTGRMHQIRQHFRLAGHPILGDRRYGGGALPGYPGHFLHSFRTTFRHPATGQPVVIHAPLPAGFLARLSSTADAAWPALLASLADLPPA